MKSFKKKLSLYLVFIMVLNLVMPFAPGFGQVVTIAAPPVNPVFNPSAPAGTLEIHPSQSLEFSTTTSRPTVTTGGRSDSVMLSWGIPAAAHDGMYVLRHFAEVDGAMRRIEMTVHTGLIGEGFPTNTLLVNFDIYEMNPPPPPPANVSNNRMYRSLRDPARGASLGFQIRLADGGAVSNFPVNADLVNSLRLSEDGVRRLNDRWRWDNTASSPFGASTFTHTHPGYPFLELSEGGYRDPLTIGVPPSVNLYDFLTPSFQISHGQGFYFNYGAGGDGVNGLDVMFLWEGGNFFVQFSSATRAAQPPRSNYIQAGRFYEFELEFYEHENSAYPGIGDAFDYYRLNIANQTWASGTATPRNYVPNRSYISHFFTGLSNFGAFPFAFADRDRNGQLWADSPYPGPQDPVYGHRHTWYEYLPGYLPAWYRNEFTTHALVKNDVTGVDTLTAQNNGMVVHFSRPMLFNESTGSFSSYDIGSRVFAGLTDAAINRLPVAVTFGAPVAPNTDDRITNFRVDLDIRDIIEDPVVVIPQPPAGVPPIHIDVVRRTSPVASDADDFIILEITNLPASAMYMSSILSVGYLPEWEREGRGVWLASQIFDLAHGPNRMFTFMHFYIYDPGVGPLVARIDPPYIIAGWYRLHSNYVPGPPLPDRPPGMGSGLLSGSWFFHDPQATAGPLEIPLPTNDAGRFYQIEFRIDHPNMGGEGIASQIIWHLPVPRPDNIPLPTNFVAEIIDPPGHRPLTPAPPNVVVDTNRGEMLLRNSWSLGTAGDFLAMISRAQAEDPGFTGEIYVDYVIMISVIPDDVEDPMSPPLAPVFIPFAGIRAIVASGSALGVTAVSYRFEMMDVNPAGYLVPISASPYIQHLPHITLRNPGLRENLTGVLPANLEFYVNTAHINLPLALRQNYPILFPAVYFMYVEARRFWSASEPPVLVGYRNPLLFRTGEDSFTISEHPTAQIPGPRNLELTAITEGVTPYRESGNLPAINVRYTIPLGEIARFTDTQFPDFRPLLTTNLYIGAFEESIRNTFFPGGVQASPEYRRSEENVVNMPYQPSWNGVVDLSQHASLFREGGPRSVVRISNIPLLGPPPETAADPPFFVDEYFADNPDLLNPFPSPPFDDPQLNPPDIENENALDGTMALIGTAQNLIMQLTLAGLDENRRYYAFVDMVMVPYRTVPANNSNNNSNSVSTPAALNILIPGAPQVSAMTAVVGEVTPGLPQIPGPDELDPPMPTGLNWWYPIAIPPQVNPRQVPYTSALVFWNPLTPVEGDIQIEYEIIRIEGGPRMRMEDRRTRETNLVSFMNSLRGDAPDNISIVYTKAWDTNDGVLRVSEGGPLVDVPPNSTLYVFHPAPPGSIVGLEDHTLSPRRQYFFYVRSVYITEVDGTLVRRVSDWDEINFTTRSVEAPVNLRDEGDANQANFDMTSMRWVSWEHDDMENKLRNIGSGYMFQYQLRIDDEQWGPIINVPAAAMTTANLLEPGNPNRIFFMLSGLDPGTLYWMRVRILEVSSGDSSNWSNVISFMTQEDQDDIDLEEDARNWHYHLRRLLEELLRRPFWLSQNTATSTHMVYRPAARFAGLMGDHPGVAVPLHNTDLNAIRYYLPVSVLRDAIDGRRGFSTEYSDLEIHMAPGMLSFDHNQVMIDMMRLIDLRGNDYSDAFVRIDINRAPITEINDAPAITRQTMVYMSIVATAGNITNIQTWEANVHTRATRIINDFINDPVLRQNIRNMLTDGWSNEEMSDWVHSMVANVDARITTMVAGYMNTGTNGILTGTTRNFTYYDAAMHLIATDVPDGSSVTGYILRDGRWVRQDLNEFRGGQALTARAPGTFAFTGREIVIHGIEEVQHGRAIHAMVGRFRLEDFFGAEIDLDDYADRYMVIGSIARIAGAPAGSDHIEWAVRNLNVSLTSRNPDGLISRQEAIAVVMALYERRANVTVQNIRIRNFRTTAGMNLDRRYAQAVRAAFEVGIMTDEDMNPTGSITVGEFLDMLGNFNNRVRV